MFVSSDRSGITISSRPRGGFGPSSLILQTLPAKSSKFQPRGLGIHSSGKAQKAVATDSVVSRGNGVKLVSPVNADDDVDPNPFGVALAHEFIGIKRRRASFVQLLSVWLLSVDFTAARNG